MTQYYNFLDDLSPLKPYTRGLESIRARTKGPLPVPAQLRLQPQHLDMKLRFNEEWMRVIVRDLLREAETTEPPEKETPAQRHVHRGGAQCALCAAGSRQRQY
jgi:hypothetical protein